MNGKYVGSRPVKIQKATTTVRQVDIGTKKARELDTKKKAHTVGNKVGPVLVSAKREATKLTSLADTGQRNDRKVWLLATLH